MSTPDTDVAGTLALVGGGEWRDGTRDLDALLLEASGGTEVLILPTAAAYEQPEHVIELAAKHFAKLGATVRELPVLHRTEAESADISEAVRDARFVYFADGSPLHLRSVLKGSALFDALLAAYRSGAVLAASGAGATVLCDPMVDPRGGAYTVGLGVVEGVAIFPYHGSAADHLRERSIDLLPANAVLVGVDEETALLRRPGGRWSVAGRGTVTIYADGTSTVLKAGAEGLALP
ncbi:MAG: Type 1 glutamine amidotransferase-like domain-containing protein [Acidimicrobiia bacterium]